MISASLLDRLRAIQRAYLTDTCSISRYTEESTSDGVVFDWSEIASGVPCRVSQTSGASAGAEQVGESAVLRAVSDWRVWLPFETDVTERDRLTITGADRTDDRTFEVTRVDEKTNETARRCLVTLVT